VDCERRGGRRWRCSLSVVRCWSFATRSSKPKTITAYFTTATGVYPGDEVRVSGVKVGTIKSIQPVGTQAKMTLLAVDSRCAGACRREGGDRRAETSSRRATSSSPPAYRTSGPKMPDGAVIPADRTAVPVEWDEVQGHN